MDPLYSPVVLATDTTDYQANTLSRIASGITEGIPAAAASGAISIYNSTIGHFAGQANEEDLIRRYGGDAVGDYYAENKSAIDLVGFVGTSLIPGSLGIKGLQAIRGGNAVGNFGKALNLTSSRKAQALEEAMKEIGMGGGVVKSILSSPARRANLMWEVADNALLGAAAELAIATTMHNSSIFDDASIADLGWNAALGVGLSGLVGGPLASIGARGLLLSAEKEVQTYLRGFDVLEETSKTTLLKGTDALNLADSMVSLPNPQASLKFGFTREGVQTTVDIPISEAAANARAQAVRVAENKLKLKFNEIAGGDVTIGQSLYESTQNALDALRSAGKTPTEQVHYLAGYLNMLRSADAVDLTWMERQGKKFYVTINPKKLPAGQINDITDAFSLTRSRATTKNPYMLADGVTSSDLVISHIDDLGVTKLKDAFRAAPNADAIQLSDGTFRFNPKSSKVLKLREDTNTVTQLLDLETLALSSDTVLSFGDIAKRGNIINTVDAVYSAGQKFPQLARGVINIAADPVQGSARYAWASGLDIAKLRAATGDVIHLDDLPVLDRLVELRAQGLVEDRVLRQMEFVHNNSSMQFDDIVDLSILPEQRRLAILAKQYDDLGKTGVAIPDTRAVAIHLNTDRAWVEDAIARGFTPARRDAQQTGRIMATAQSMNPRTVQMTWDFGSVTGGKAGMLPEEAYNMNMGPANLVVKELTRQYQTQVATKINVTAADSVLGTDSALFPHESEFLANGTKMSMDTEARGAGATLLGASNAGYTERAKLFVQDMGKNVQLLSQRYADEAVGSLAPHVNALRSDTRASAELGALTTALRKSEHRYVFDPTNPERIISEAAMAQAKSMDGDVDMALDFLSMSGGRSPHSFSITSPDVMEFLITHTKIDRTRQEKLTTLYNAAGQVRKLPDIPVIYVPPINTVKYPYHAFVKTKNKVGLATDVGMITAKDEAQLRTLVAKVSDDYDVFFKKDTDEYYKAKGLYEYQNTLNTGLVNSDLARRGVLADAFPEMRLENIMEDWLGYHVKQSEKLVRNAVQTKNRTFFNELDLLSEQYRRVPESQTRGLGAKLKSKIADPFGDYIKTALNISKQNEFPLLDSLNEFIDKVGVSMGTAWERGFRNARKGVIDWKEADAILEEYGLPRVYTQAGEEAFLAANERMPANVIKFFAQKTNVALATTTLRLDFFNSLINMISTPIMIGTEMSSIKRMIANDAQVSNKLSELTTIKVPGRDMRVPSTTKLLADSVSNYFGPESAALVQRYKDIGSIKGVAQLHREVLDDLAFDPLANTNRALSSLHAGIEKAATITGNNFSEEFTRFVSADVMRQLTDPLVSAGKMNVKEQNAFISTFVNRVQGNYVTSQRPVVFQGTTGAAVSLFQTYAFNVLQQLFRHVQSGDKKTLAIFAGLQASAFGLNGLPFFDAANTYILGRGLSNNPNHQDAYSVLPAFNKELGDWMLYGTASAFPLFSGSLPALYSRGDINPRHITILPNSIADVPAVSASLKLIDTISEFGKNVGGGADITNSMLLALEHQGWNRPLAGFAQVLAGRATTSKGALISAANELETTSMLANFQERMVNFGGVARILGARPMDESVALGALYREKRYEAMDKARIERLGEVVKTKLYNNSVPTDEEYEDFMLRYARSGGRIETFNQAYMRWTRDANESVITQMLQKNGNPFSQKLFQIMGGEE